MVQRDQGGMALVPHVFQKLSRSNLAAQCSEQISLAAMPLVAVIYLGAEGYHTSVLQLVQSLPFLLLSIPLGLLVDRSARKKVMILAEVLRAMALIVIALMLLFHAANLTLLAGVGFCIATGTVAFNVAMPALTKTLVSSDLLGLANRKIELTRSIAFALGPAIGGALVGWVAVDLVFIGAAMLSFLSVGYLTGLPKETVVRPPVARAMLTELKIGIDWVYGHPLLRPIVNTAMIFNIAWFLLLAIYTPYAINYLGMRAGEVGLTLGTLGLGMVLGAYMAPRLNRYISFGTQVF